MKALVIYDSVYGNTKRIAEAVAKEIPGSVLVNVKDANYSLLSGIGLLVMGSPTHGGNESPALQKFIAGIPKDSLRGMKVACFDTWISQEGQGFLTRAAVGIFGHAAPRTLARLQHAGGSRTGQPEGFFVKGKQGPLAEGELERAREWARKLVED